MMYYCNMVHKWNCFVTVKNDEFKRIINVSNVIDSFSIKLECIIGIIQIVLLY